MVEETPEIRSAVGPAGKRSPRRYTRSEIAAARRLGLVSGNEKKDLLGGPLFWATGDHYPKKVQRVAEDAVLVGAAIQREWGATGDTEGGTDA